MGRNKRSSGNRSGGKKAFKGSDNHSRQQQSGKMQDVRVEKKHMDILSQRAPTSRLAPKGKLQRQVSASPSVVAVEVLPSTASPPSAALVQSGGVDTSQHTQESQRCSSACHADDQVGSTRPLAEADVTALELAVCTEDEQLREQVLEAELDTELNLCLGLEGDEDLPASQAMEPTPATDGDEQILREMEDDIISTFSQLELPRAEEMQPIDLAALTPQALCDFLEADLGQEAEDEYGPPPLTPIDEDDDDGPPPLMPIDEDDDDGPVVVPPPLMPIDEEDEEQDEPPLASEKADEWASVASVNWKELEDEELDEEEFGELANLAALNWVQDDGTSDLRDVCSGSGYHSLDTPLARTPSPTRPSAPTTSSPRRRTRGPSFIASSDLAHLRETGELPFDELHPSYEIELADGTLATRRFQTSECECSTRVRRRMPPRPSPAQVQLACRRDAAARTIQAAWRASVKRHALRVLACRRRELALQQKCYQALIEMGFPYLDDPIAPAEQPPNPEAQPVEFPAVNPESHSSAAAGSEGPLDASETSPAEHSSAGSAAGSPQAHAQIGEACSPGTLGFDRSAAQLPPAESAAPDSFDGLEATPVCIPELPPAEASAAHCPETAELSSSSALSPEPSGAELPPAESADFSHPAALQMSSFGTTDLQPSAAELLLVDPAVVNCPETPERSPVESADLVPFAEMRTSANPAAGSPMPFPLSSSPGGFDVTPEKPGRRVVVIRLECRAAGAELDADLAMLSPLPEEEEEEQWRAVQSYRQLRLWVPGQQRVEAVVQRCAFLLGCLAGGVSGLVRAAQSLV